MWFCHSNGICDPAKPRFICESGTEYHLDFIALLETKRNDFHLAELAHFYANNFLWD
jgi:exonuclease III